MSEGFVRNIVIRAMFKDACSGVLRLVGDVQRFRFGFQTLTLTREHDGFSLAMITVSIPSGVDTEVVAARLARHPEIQSVVVHRDGDCCDDRSPRQSRASKRDSYAQSGG
jgi:hypothetical protein